MSHSARPKTWVRVVNGLAALALVALCQLTFWPVLKTFDLHRADLGYQGVWVEGHAKRITSVIPGGPADRAGLKPGDVFEFDPKRAEDWVLASYRNMPEGFSATLPVRHADATRTVVSITPDRVAFLPTLTDRTALLTRMIGGLVFALMGVFLVWVRPSAMTWFLVLWSIAGLPSVLWAHYFLAFEATHGFQPLALVPPLSLCMVVWMLPFAAIFPRTTATGWSRWKLVGLVATFFAWAAYLSCAMHLMPFEREPFPQRSMTIWALVTVASEVGSIAALIWNYRHSDVLARAKLRWGILGMTFAFVLYLFWTIQFVTRFAVSGNLSGSFLTPGQWVFAFTNLVVFPISFGYAVLRQRVVDVQFAISRTVVYGVVSTIVLVFLAVLHWLLGRVLEHSGLAFGLEGLAAIGLGLVLHRASHGINTGVDRVLFRKHHAAEERLRQVTAALPFASTERSIAEAIVVEPTRNLELASAALFYRESAEGPLRRVLAEGWGEAHATELDAESLLVRYLQAEHRALRLDGEQQWLAEGMPEGAAHPVLAIPIVTQHELTAVVLYGTHVNSTLPDPDEVELLEALAKAAAASHQQVRIAVLMRETESQRRRLDQQQERISDLEKSAAELRAVLGARLAGEGS